MLVSAISANYNQVARPINYGYINSRGGDNNADTTVNSFITSRRKDGADNNGTDVYNSINEWKDFCHKQIAGGKLDIIA